MGQSIIVSILIFIVAISMTMVEFGATGCIPCKMMAPIMEKLEGDYRLFWGLAPFIPSFC